MLLKKEYYRKLKNPQEYKSLTPVFWAVTQHWKAAGCRPFENLHSLIKGECILLSPFNL